MRYLLSVLLGFSSGLIVAGGIFAFIAVIGVVPRLAQKTRTKQHIRLYEDMILLGGFFGSMTLFLDFHFPIGTIFAMVFALATGVFVGVLAVSLAEVLNVVPVFMRRVRLSFGLPILIAALAFGKVAGALLYFFVPDFFL